MDTETVTVIRAVGRDNYGDPLPGPDVTFDVPGVLFAPGKSGETHDGANMVTTDAAIYTPPGTDIAAADKVRARGDLFDVVGDPEDWGSAAGVIAHLRRTTG